MEEMLKEYPAILEVSDVADILHITPATVRRHIRTKDIPSIRIGNLTRIPKDRFIAYLEKQ